MTEVNNFPQLMELARQLPSYPWDQRLSACLDGPRDQWPSDEEIEAQIKAESPIYLAEHADLIASARRLLHDPCANHEPASQEAWRTEATENQQAARQLGSVLVQAAAAAFSNDDGETVFANLESCFRLSQAVRRGGLILEYLIACIIEGGGIICIERNRRRLPLDMAQRLIRLLESHELAREPYDIIADRDEAWTAAHTHESDEQPEDYSPPPSIFDDIELPEPDERMKIIENKHRWLESGDPEEQAWKQRRHMQEADLRNISLLRLLRIELALSAYKAEHDCYPRRLSALAPSLLSEVPIDPHGDRPFRYRRRGSDYQLYGRDAYGDDHGGKRGSVADVSYGLADLFVNAHDLPPTEDVRAMQPGILGRLAGLFGSR